jgi:cyclopropane-fatty-acyl-phospholipid synthase
LINSDTLQFSRNGYVVDYLFYALWIVAASCALVLFGPRREWLDMALLAAGGLIVWSFLEYALHRFILHGVDPFRRWHAEHHDNPSALVGTPTFYSATLFVLLVFVPACALTDFWKGSGLTLGVLIGYLAFGSIHHAVHHWRPRTPWLKRRKQLHALHHRLGDRHFGVSTSFWDRIFRTAGR